MKALRVGVVGAGNIASIAQLPTLVQRDDVELRALVSRRDDPGAIQRRWGFEKVYRGVDAMLDAEALDAIFVLTPRSEHVAAVESALRAGVDVFCEKPLATSTADATRPTNAVSHVAARPIACGKTVASLRINPCSPSSKGMIGMPSRVLSTK